MPRNILEFNFMTTKKIDSEMCLLLLLSNVVTIKSLTQILLEKILIHIFSPSYGLIGKTCITKSVLYHKEMLQSKKYFLALNNLEMVDAVENE